MEKNGREIEEGVGHFDETSRKRTLDRLFKIELFLTFEQLLRLYKVTLMYWFSGLIPPFLPNTMVHCFLSIVSII